MKNLDLLSWFWISFDILVKVADVLVVLDVIGLLRDEVVHIVFARFDHVFRMVAETGNSSAEVLRFQN